MTYLEERMNKSRKWKCHDIHEALNLAVYVSFSLGGGVWTFEAKKANIPRVLRTREEFYSYSLMPINQYLSVMGRKRYVPSP